MNVPLCDPAGKSARGSIGRGDGGKGYPGWSPGRPFR